VHCSELFISWFFIIVGVFISVSLSCGSSCQCHVFLVTKRKQAEACHGSIVRLSCKWMYIAQCMNYLHTCTWHCIVYLVTRKKVSRSVSQIDCRAELRRTRLSSWSKRLSAGHYCPKRSKTTFPRPTSPPQARKNRLYRGLDPHEANPWPPRGGGGVSQNLIIWAPEEPRIWIWTQNSAAGGILWKFWQKTPTKRWGNASRMTLCKKNRACGALVFTVLHCDTGWSRNQLNWNQHVSNDDRWNGLDYKNQRHWHG
jgi:hypothetical protein